MDTDQLSEEQEFDALEDDVDGGSFGDEEPELQDEDELAGDVATSDQAAVDAITEEVGLDNRLLPLSLIQMTAGRLAIAKLRALANKIVNSPTIKADLQHECTRAGLEPKMMIRDVSIRWNSTAELIQRALYLREPLKALVPKTEFNRPRGVRLLRFQLKPQEWYILERLSPLLEVFLYATKVISESDIPLIHEVIPVFDVITTALDKFIDNFDLSPVVQHAALRGMLMQNKYYALTDDSIVYRLAMILHPAYKTSYFAKAGWEHDWIVAAENLTRNEWKNKYKPSVSNLVPLEQGKMASDERFAGAKEFFAILHTRAVPGDALEEWLVLET